MKWTPILVFKTFMVWYTGKDYAVYLEATGNDAKWSFWGVEQTLDDAVQSINSYKRSRK